MEIHIRALVLYLLLDHSVLGEERTSPCPDVLRYESKTEEGKFYGTISVGTEYDLEGVYIKIYLDRKAQLLGNWFATAISNDQKEFQIRNPDYKLAAGPPIQIRFFIEHDPEDVPNIIKITVNGRVICSETKQVRRPDIPLYLSSDVSNRSTSNFDPVLLEHIQKKNQTTTTIKPSSEKTVESVESRHQFNSVERNDTKSRSAVEIQCGTVAQLPKSLIHKGQNTIPGQFPWHVALYYSSEAEIKYVCGGTLVSERHVVSAAHCVTKPNSKQVQEIDRYLIYLGKYSLSRFGSEIQEQLVDSIDVHPDYNPLRLHNDISIIKLKSAVKITNYVRPACLWEGDSNFNNVIGKIGTMVGWGYTARNELSQTLTKADMPIIAKDTCIFSNPTFFTQFLHETSNFCVGYRNGTTACNGDSGGGFVLPRPGTSGDNAVWQLRGIVSAAVATQSTTGSTVCNPNQYSIFTDAAIFVPWLKSKMSSCRNRS